MTSTDPAAPTAEATATHQPVLPTLELPEYHGIKPIGMRTSVNGTGNRLASAHGIGDRTVLVLEVKCKKAGHEDTDDGLVYHEVHKVVDMFELDRDAGTRLLRFLRSTYRTESDAARGVTALPDLGDAGYTDGSGVVLLPDEIAELRGDVVLRLIGSDAETPVVAVYDNGSRLLWPDEYEPGTARPYVGETNDDGARVTELLHHATGEPLDDDGTELPDDPDDEGDPFPADAVRARLAGATPPPADAVFEAIGPIAEPDVDAFLHISDPPTVFDPVRGVWTEGTSGTAAAETFKVTGAPFPVTAELADWEGDPGDHRRADPTGYDDGTYTDGVPGYTDPTPEPDPDAPLTAGEAELAEIAPDAFAYEFVNVPVPELRTKLADVADVVLLRRFLEAEKLGRGKGHSPRRGALDAIYNRLGQRGWTES